MEEELREILDVGMKRERGEKIEKEQRRKGRSLKTGTARYSAQVLGHKEQLPSFLQFSVHRFKMI